MSGFLAFLLIVPGILLRGYVLSQLWIWFIVPTLGFRPISTLEAVGLSLTGIVFDSSAWRVFDEDKRSSSFTRTVIVWAFTMLLWFEGWLIHLALGVWG